MKRLYKWLKKYFFPHDGNQYKPHMLRHEAALVFFLIIIVVELGLLVQVFFVFDKTKFLAAVLPGVLTTLTNQERAQNNAAPLTENTLLDKAAQMKANDMATLGYFAHTSPEGKTPWYWFDQVGYNYSYAGENLAVNFFESEDVAQAWMNSPTHRANIVKPEYTEIGIGVANGVYEGKNTVYVAQLFGKPLEIAPAENLPPVIPSTPPSAPKSATAKVVASKPKTVTPKVAVATPTAVKVLGEESTTSNVTVVSTLAKEQSAMRSFLQRILSSPREYVNYIYGGIAGLIILVLLLMLFIKSELRHPAILARGLTLIAIIVALSYVNIRVFSNQTQVPQSGLGANSIDALPQ